MVSKSRVRTTNSDRVQESAVSPLSHRAVLSDVPILFATPGDLHRVHLAWNVVVPPHNTSYTHSAAPTTPHPRSMRQSPHASIRWNQQCRLSCRRSLATVPLLTVLAQRRRCVHLQRARRGHPGTKQREDPLESVGKRILLQDNATQLNKAFSRCLRHPKEGPGSSIPFLGKWCENAHVQSARTPAPTQSPQVTTITSPRPKTHLWNTNGAENTFLQHDRDQNNL